MIRFVFIFILLLSVLSIGLPFDHPLWAPSYRFLRFFGLDVSMTPITVDMSMMTDEHGQLVYAKDFSLELFLENKNIREVFFQELDFYRHKVPLNLYFEILGNGGSMPEGKTYLCRAFSELSPVKVTGFMLKTRKRKDSSRGFNELQKCN